MKQVVQNITLILIICLAHRVLNDFDWVTALLGGFLVAFYHNLFNDKESKKDANV